MFYQYVRFRCTWTEPSEQRLYLWAAARRQEATGSPSKTPQHYIHKSLDDDVKYILCYVWDHDYQNAQWRISLPESMLRETVKWFHIVVYHPGEKQLRDSCHQLYHHHKLCHTIDKYKCEHCQRHKRSGECYGLLPEREMKIENLGKKYLSIW